MSDTVNIRDAKFLLVDDKEANLVLLEQVLLSAGYSHITSTQDPYAVC